MSLASRVKGLEAKFGGDEPLVVMFVTHYEDKNGDIESTCCRAFIHWGEGQNESVEQCSAESESDFKARINELQAMPYPQAQAAIAAFDESASKTE